MILASFKAEILVEFHSHDSGFFKAEILVKFHSHDSGLNY